MVFLATKALQPAIEPKCTLSEGPVWDHRQNCLWWVDIPCATIYRWDATTNEVKRIVVPGITHIGFAIPTSTTDILICGSEKGLFLFNTLTRQVNFFAEMPPSPPGSRLRFNDAKVDVCGRLVAGTMDMAEKDQIGSLFLVTSGDIIAEGHQKKALTRISNVGSVTISNGLDWCPCARRMYYVDSPTQQVKYFAYSHHDGNVSTDASSDNGSGALFPLGQNGAGHVLTQLTQKDWYPDGMCVDEAGYLWVAIWNGSRVVRISPDDGRIVGEVLVPVKRVTSVCFGGPRLSQLFISTAKGNDVNAPPDAGEEDTAGSIYVANVGVCGMPFNPFELHPSQKL